MWRGVWRSAAESAALGGALTGMVTSTCVIHNKAGRTINKPVRSFILNKEGVNTFIDDKSITERETIVGLSEWLVID